MLLLDLLVGGVMLASAVAAMLSRSLLSAVILVGAVGLIAAYSYVRLGAPDVAMTEAAIGSALSTVIFLVAVRRTQEMEE